MKIIPVINCQDFESVKARVQVAKESLFPMVRPEERWFHIDVADGGFTNGYSTWRNPEDLASLKLSPEINVELHLMMNEPEQACEQWFSAGISRLIFHLESTSALEVVVAACRSRGVEPMLALTPSTPAAHAVPYLAGLPGCQILAVHPGLAGQKMEPDTLDKIKAIRTRFPEILIEVDGGVTPETAPLMKQAGATQIVAGSSIFSADNPSEVYKKYLEL